MPNNRNYKDPKYIKWRKAVLGADKATCVKCKKNKGVDLEVHHIRPWSKHINLRFNVRNGVTLCRQCHEYVTGEEEKYIDFFDEIVANRIDSQKKFKYKPRNPNLLY